MRKRILSVIACGFLSLATTAPGLLHAEDGGADASIVMKLEDPHALVGGKPYLLQSAPTLVHDVTLIPLRFVGEAIGAAIDWNEGSQTVTITTAVKTIVLTVGSSQASVDGKPFTLEQPALLMNDTTMVPLRFIAEQLGQSVDFDEGHQTITLAKERTNGVSQAEQVKLSPPTVDNLVPDPDGGKLIAQATQVLSVAVDRAGNVYSLRNYASDGYKVVKYEPAHDRTSTVFQIDGKLNFDYVDAPPSTFVPPLPSAPRKGTFVYSTFEPDQLYYNPIVDRVYVLGGSVAYSFEPEVKMETHPFTFLNPLPPDSDKKSFGSGQHLPAMFETTDGETFYWGGSWALFSSKKGGGTRFLTKTYLEANSQLESTVKEGHIYTYDMNTGTISMLTEEGLQSKAEAQVEGAVNVVGAYGYFYVMTPEQIYKVAVDGQKTLLVNRKDLKFNKGMFKEKTKAYEPTDAYDPAELRFNKFLRYAVDRDESIVLYDEQSRMVRRINIFEQK